MRLTDLTEKAGKFEGLDILGLTADSRDVQPGWLFAALPGVKTDGRNFIADAIAHGAVAILAAPGTSLPAGSENIALITDENPRRAFTRIVAKFYPQQPRIIAAVTGTNGKTSTVQFARQIWQQLGEKAASLGTLGVIASGSEKTGTSWTTPDPVTLHSEIAELAHNGVTHLAVEATSHGLDQYRLDGLKVSVAGFTNLTRDHLDYHGDMQTYRAAKARLFSHLLQPGGIAVLNADSPEFPFFEKTCANRGIRVLSFGYKGKDLKLEKRTPNPAGQTLELSVFGKKQKIELPLVGEVQAYNVLTAAGLVLAENPDDQVFRNKVMATLEKLSGVRGRLEFVTMHPSGAAIYVDYAHTPDALETLLAALRPHTQNRLHVVFGCGGDRDRGKRPLMGRIAVDKADVAIVTDDNPRTEDPAFIRSEIMAASPGAIEIGDRAQAIRKAVSELKNGDILVIAGKGHEQGQIIGATVKPFDDASVARDAVRELAA